MILRAQAVGEDPCIRFVVIRLEDGAMWDGQQFTGEFDSAKKYWHPSDACIDMQAILKEHYQYLPEKKYIVPVEITVLGPASRDEIAEYLFQASVLSLRTEEYDNGPNGSLVSPVIHWGLIKNLPDQLDEDPDDPNTAWGNYMDLDDI
ncbi:hypothetical protein N9D23_00720 [Rubripirellula sp.]|nr:hypothetical protein [Rubripirellula sp.]